MVKVLMLSKWHVHQEGYANDVNKQPDAKVTCVWDTDVQRGQEWAGRLGAAFEADLDKALSRSDVDAVVVGTPTTAHREVIIKAAQHGKHIFTEKALATTMEDCRAIADAVEKSGVKFVISYPQLTNPLVQLCKQAIAENWLGDIHYMRMRVAHDGASRGWLPAYWYNAEDAGGGAMMDLGCHPMYTASYLLGKPRRITSMFNTPTPQPAWTTTPYRWWSLKTRPSRCWKPRLYRPIRPTALSCWAHRAPSCRWTARCASMPRALAMDGLRRTSCLQHCPCPCACGWMPSPRMRPSCLTWSARWH